MLVTVDNFAETMEKLDKASELSVDSETTGLEIWKNKVCPADDKAIGDRQVGISIGHKEIGYYYFPWRHVTGNLPGEKFVHMKNLLSKEDLRYVGFNLPFDMQIFLRDGIPLHQKIHDAQTAAHLLNENEDRFALKPLSDKYLGKESSLASNKLDGLLESKGLAKNEMWRLPPSDVEEYACDDTRLAEALRDFYTPALQRWRLYDLWEEVNEYTVIITEMMAAGVPLNVPLIHEYMTRCESEVVRTRGVVERLAGYPINLNSPKQLSKWLGLPSTAADVLEGIAGRDGVKELLEFRSWRKTKDDYLGKFLRLMDENNHIHCGFNLCGTISSRLSATNPPLQALPRQGESKPALSMVKDTLVTDPGDVLVEGDVNQAELRLVAFYGQDDVLKQEILDEVDRHAVVSKELGITRDQAKGVNYSSIYGVGYKTLSERMEWTEAHAKTVLNGYHNKYKGFRRLYNYAERSAEEKLYIRMFSGRIRHFGVVTAPTHKASSNLVQGSTAEMIRISTTRIKRELGISYRGPRKLLLQVHDSLLVSTPESDAMGFAAEMQKIMQDHPWCSVPIRVDMKIGPHYGAMKKVKFA